MARLAVCGSWWLLKTWSRTVGREDKIIPIIKRHLLQLPRRDSRCVPLLNSSTPCGLPEYRWTFWSICRVSDGEMKSISR